MRWTTRRFLAAVSALALGLRLFRLGHQSLWVDEIFTLTVATPKPGYPIYQLLAHNVHGPLHTFVVYLFRFFGENDAWVRLPSALAGAASPGLLYAWTRRRVDERVARAAAVILALHPLHVWYSQELRNYAFLVAFACAAMVAFDRLCDAARRGEAFRPIRYALAMAGALLSNFSAAFLAAAQTLLWFARGGFTRRNVLRWVITALVVLVLIAPWAYRLWVILDVGRLVTPVSPGEIAPQERLRGETTFTLAAVPYAAWTFCAGFTLGPSLRELHVDPVLGDVVRRHAGEIAAVAIVFGVLALSGIRGARRRGVAGMLSAYLVLPLVLCLFLAWQNAKAFNVRYVLVALPAWCVVLATGLEELPRRARVAVAAGALAVIAASLGNLYANPRYAREDVRGAMRYVEAHGASDDCVLAPTVVEVAQHYAVRPERVHAFYGAGVSEESRRRQLDEAFAGCKTLWYVRARPWVEDADGWLLRELPRRGRETERIEFAGVTLVRYALVESPTR